MRSATVESPSSQITEIPRGPVMRAQEAATYLGIAKQTLAKLRCVGGGPVFLKAGRTVLYRVEHLNAWLDSHDTRRSTSDSDARGT